MTRHASVAEPQGSKRHEAKKSQQQAGSSQSDGFQAIGIAAVVAASLKGQAKPQQTQRDMPPCLRKDQFEN